jgi:hypothetical protein
MWMAEVGVDFPHSMEHSIPMRAAALILGSSQEEDIYHLS